MVWCSTCQDVRPVQWDILQGLMSWYVDARGSMHGFDMYKDRTGPWLRPLLQVNVPLSLEGGTNIYLFLAALKAKIAVRKTTKRWSNGFHLASEIGGYRYESFHVVHFLVWEILDLYWRGFLKTCDRRTCWRLFEMQDKPQITDGMLFVFKKIIFYLFRNAEMV